MKHSIPPKPISSKIPSQTEIMNIILYIFKRTRDLCQQITAKMLYIQTYCDVDFQFYRSSFYVGQF